MKTKLRSPLHRTTLACAVLAVVSVPVAASTFGSLANFDAVNDTGHEAYGFEIVFEDSHFYSDSVGSVFGLNRVFTSVSNNPLDVVRFRQATVVDYNDAAGLHAGVRITYGGNLGAGAITTPFNDPLHPYNTPGESCWPGANLSWAANPCDHFGATTLGSPAATHYNWLILAAPGAATLSRQVAGLPPVSFVYTPAVPAAPGQVAVDAALQVQIRAVAAPLEAPGDGARWGEAFWVKTYTTKVRRNIDLANLLRGDHDMEAAEVESEWGIFQNAPRDRVGDGPNELKEKKLQLGDADKAVMRRYEFYKYAGPLDPDGMGQSMCDTACENDPYGLVGGHANFVGSFVGAQMAGFNVNQAAVVPEPAAWALLLAGAAAMGLRLRRRRAL